MKQTIIKCDICGSEKKVISARMPMYRMFDSTDGRTFYDTPNIVFETIDICEECLRKSTNIFDQRVMGYGDIRMLKNPTIKQ